MNSIHIGVVGAGTMGAGIAQVAAQSGHQVVLLDANPEALTKAENGLRKVYYKLIEKEKITVNNNTTNAIYVGSTSDLQDLVNQSRSRRKALDNNEEQQPK